MDFGLVLIVFQMIGMEEANLRVYLFTMMTVIETAITVAIATNKKTMMMMIMMRMMTLEESIA